jgi:myo-inositol-1(or 4)-monophosphatase
MPVADDDLADIEAVVPAILAAAGQIALRWFRTALTADDKNAGTSQGYDPVTEADRGVEDLIRERLHAHFPGHEVVGEERGSTGPAGRFRWMIDPIDGTRAFVSGSPLWGILLGLLDDGVPVAGWVHQPYLDETFAAVGGTATFTHAGVERPLVARAGAELATAVLYTTSPDLFVTAAERGAFERLADAVQLVRFGGDCYSYCMVAMGQVDLVIDVGLQPYDIVPLIPIIESAGGVVTGVGGDPRTGGFVVAAANADLAGRALALIGDVPPR